MMTSDDDYYLFLALYAVEDYFKKKYGIEGTEQDIQRYKSILKYDEEFHVFAFFEYELLITYDNNTDDLEITEIKGGRSGKYTNEDFTFIKYCVGRFAGMEDFLKAYREFKEVKNADNIIDKQALNKEFRKEFDIPDTMAIPDDLANLIDTIIGS